jgi:hypothetical protein
MAKIPALNASVVAPLLAIGSGWATWLLFWPLGMWIYLPLLVWAGRQGRRSAVLGLVPSPFFVVPLIGAVTAGIAFTRGQAVLHQRGLATVESQNLHPVHRVPMAPPRLDTDERARFYRLPYDGVVRALGTLTGPMPNSYTGPYPTRDRAWAHLDDAPSALLDRDALWLDGTGLRVPRLMPFLWPDRRKVRAMQVGQTVVVGHPNQLWLLDGRTGRTFATYRRTRLGWLTDWPAPATRPQPAVAGLIPRTERYASPAY